LEQRKLWKKQIQITEKASLNCVLIGLLCINVKIAINQLALMVCNLQKAELFQQSDSDIAAAVMCVIHHYDVIEKKSLLLVFNYNYKLL